MGQIFVCVIICTLLWVDSFRSIPMLGVGRKRDELYYCDTGLQTVRTNTQKTYKILVNDEIFQVIIGTATAAKCICDRVRID